MNIKFFLLPKVIVMALLLSVGSCGIAVLLSRQQSNNKVITSKNNQTNTQNNQQVNTLVDIKTASADVVNPNAKQIVPKQFEGSVIYNGKTKQGKTKENQTKESQTKESQTKENQTKESQHKNRKKLVALTFDDGPSPKYTSKVLKILKKNNAKGTFFWLGKMVEANPSIAKEVVAEGHVIGNHTWNHLYHQMSVEAATKEIKSTTDIIYKTTGVKTNLFRPPGGHLHNGLVDYAKNNGYLTVMWSEDTRDFSQPPASQIVNRATKTVTNGSIILMHDAGGKRDRTLEALPQIISNLKAKGYEFVTLPELLQD